jgi:hypothetical protein
MVELLIKLMLGGGLFAIMAFIHFATDWIFQSHAEAMVKHNHAKVRAKHCLIYTAGFIPLLAVFGGVGFLTTFEYVMSLGILFLSHFYLDTYHGVYLWAKYIRRPPELVENPNTTGFIAFVSTTLGKILMIAIDQISHLAFLFPIVWMVMRHVHLAPHVFWVK